MTRVVELVINAAQEGIAEQDLQAGLSKLYGKPPEHFDKLIHQVCTVKQPYTLLKEVKEEVAAKHIAKLEQIGLECSMEMSLALVPVGGETDAAAAPGKPTCPVCKEPTSSQDVCSSCGVDLRKANSAKQSADAIQRTLESAEQELKNKKKQQTLEAEKQRKEKEERAAKEKAEAAKKEAEKPPVKDIFTAEYADEDEEKKRKIKLAGAAAVVAAGVIAFSTGTFTSDPGVATEASGELSASGDVDADAEAGADDAADGTASDGDAAADPAAPTAAGGDQVASAAGAGAAASPGAAPQASAAMTQNIVAAATAKVEAGTPNAGAADDFDETIAKFERMAEMQGDGRSAEQVANDLAINAANNKAIFQQIANKTGAPGGTLQMPSSLNGAAGGAATGDLAKQIQSSGVSSLQEVLAKYSANKSTASGDVSGVPTVAGNAGTGSYRDAYLDHWVSRKAKADRMAKLVNKFSKQGEPELARNLVDETSDKWLAIHGHHKLAIAEQMSGDAEGSQSRMMNLFVDLMAVNDLPEKIAALADHAQTWHLMLNATEADNAFDQMRSLAAAPMKPRQEIVANVAMAQSLKTTGMKRDAREHFDKALAATLSVSDQHGARDEMIHFIALAEADSRFADEALSHAGKIRDENLRRAAYQSLYQTFSRYGMDQQAKTALKKIGGAEMPDIDRAALEKMLKNGPKLSEIKQ